MRSLATAKPGTAPIVKREGGSWLCYEPPISQFLRPLSKPPGRQSINAIVLWLA
jgi:hypothetical protein